MLSKIVYAKCGSSVDDFVYSESEIVKLKLFYKAICTPKVSFGVVCVSFHS